MNEYFLKILSRQRHEEILAEIRAAQLSKPGHFCGILGNKSLRRLRSFFLSVKAPWHSNRKGKFKKNLITID